MIVQKYCSYMFLVHIQYHSPIDIFNPSQLDIMNLPLDSSLFIPHLILRKFLNRTACPPSFSKPQTSPVAPWRLPDADADEEHITSDIGSVGDFAAGSEVAFGTILQRTYSVLGARMHYGHPDIMNKQPLGCGKEVDRYLSGMWKGCGYLSYFVISNRLERSITYIYIS